MLMLMQLKLYILYKFGKYTESKNISLLQSLKQSQLDAQILNV